MLCVVMHATGKAAIINSNQHQGPRQRRDKHQPRDDRAGHVQGAVASSSSLPLISIFNFFSCKPCLKNYHRPTGRLQAAAFDATRHVTCHQSFFSHGTSKLKGSTRSGQGEYFCSCGAQRKTVAASLVPL